MGAKKKRVKRPSLFWLMTEGSRSVAELGVSFPYQLLFSGKGAGDRHPVLVLPGFMATDVSTIYLRRYVRRLGYTPYAWQLGRNYGKPEFLDQLELQIAQIYEQHSEKISVIGFSLGGVFARELGKRHADKIRQVITLGSPFLGVGEANNVSWLFSLLNGNKKPERTNEQLLKDIPRPAPVPTTAIYTKQDGIVPWRLCMEIEETSIHQNIEVLGSHFGLIHNLSVMRIISDRLQYSRGNWMHFQSDNILEDWLLYPSL